MARREVLDRGDVARLRVMLAERPEPAVTGCRTGATTFRGPARWATWPCCGDVSVLLRPGTPERDRVEALRIAAEHGRLDVIDRLLAAGTPVDGVDHDGSTALHEAACSGRADTVSHLVAAGADPGRRDTRFAGTPLGRCRHRRAEVGPGLGHGEVEAVLAPITPGEA